MIVPYFAPRRTADSASGGGRRPGGGGKPQMDEALAGGERRGYGCQIPTINDDSGGAVARYRNALPQTEDGATVLTDGGLETALIFHDGIDLPYFAACELLRSEHGMRVLLDYFDESASIAAEAGLPFAVESPTWRANPDWTTRLGYSAEEFAEVNREGVRMAEEVRRRHETARTPVVIAGVVGPRSSGYSLQSLQSAQQAAEYHYAQMGVFAETQADYISAMTLTYSDEAVGMARAAEATGMPIVISFTVETNGLLASGESLRRAIEAVDTGTDAYPEYYMINCAHPTHLPAGLDSAEPWARRIRGYRANASLRSHREINAADDLDDGDPHELAQQLRELRERMPQLSVVGGCCGSDSRHTRAIAAALLG
jgi:S-methylmethionine-dependent homocysteine/selenocysteine methylase